MGSVPGSRGSQVKEMTARWQSHTRRLFGCSLERTASREVPRSLRPSRSCMGGGGGYRPGERGAGKCCGRGGWEERPCLSSTQSLSQSCQMGGGSVRAAPSHQLSALQGGEAETKGSENPGNPPARVQNGPSTQPPEAQVLTGGEPTSHPHL